MVHPRGTPSTGRHRIEMALRVDKNRRQVTFSKRRSGLFKKCSELALLCGADLAVIVFSEAGNVFALGSPSVDAVLRRYVPLPAAANDAGVDEDDDREALEKMCQAKEATAKQLASEIERMNLIGYKVIEAQGEKRFWWEADVDALGAAELPVFARSLERLRDNLRRHADKLPSGPPPAATAVVAYAGDAASNYLA
ncbi:agamous-like MADS-box protein AGL29 [Lolium perenne]|uniref:agamous-like MADS-box protein AGL29 n=1 Tax=Lolium perenne TaxID=4522 RepID=UPI0021EA96C0|nr:agamous-like MADS-box protein AGL62 [Lolium perenne]